MRTPASLLYVSSPMTRKPAAKRRRLNHTNSSSTIDPGFQPSKALTDNSSFTSNFVHGSSKLSCSTCHRTLSTTTRPAAGVPPVCSRCSAPTCTICARTCASYTRPSSVPPTPALTRSSSPCSSTAHTPVSSSGSPKRVALGLSFTTMNCDPSVTPAPARVKRKKTPTDKDDNLGLRDHETDGDSCEGVEDGSVFIPGCGRVVCRACCVESVPK
ncbi:hypothetical protein PAXRUDRAFT_829147 [Paxillus rubicundulus Ve08.2h10]|uniref:Uncharacterized protein n=1 Tax=Paxillus rubicundulus Ve08.2h10 TaxID=930991 RepID=A0A0D0E0F7_9AGAM|nr:hypothetical protein PAXRUDRAFT_829147 [Paxillus rubicundulus Ve08.2h10]